MSEVINLSKPPSTDACFSYSQAKIHVKPNQDKIELGQFFLDPIHSNILGPYLPSCLGAKYYVTFVDNYDITSKVILLSSKDGVLSDFDLFQKHNQFGKACI